MDEQSFQQKLTELIDKIRELPAEQRGDLEEIAEQAKARRDKVAESITELQGSLDHLRLSVKYLVFDLEATRRENAYLRKLVEQSNVDRQDADQDDDNFMSGGEFDA